MQIRLMARLMAFDYGSKRLGIAVSDPLQIIATSLTTIHPKDCITFLNTYLASEVVSCFIVGEPRQIDNTLSETAGQANAFVKLLNKNFPLIPVKRINERMTSQLAMRSLIDSGVKKMERRNKALLDSVSATIILQVYMESIEGK